MALDGQVLSDIKNAIKEGFAEATKSSFNTNSSDTKDRLEATKESQETVNGAIGKYLQGLDAVIDKLDSYSNKKIGLDKDTITSKGLDPQNFKGVMNLNVGQLKEVREKVDAFAKELLMQQQGLSDSQKKLNIAQEKLKEEEQKYLDSQIKLKEAEASSNEKARSKAANEAQAAEAAYKAAKDAKAQAERSIKAEKQLAKIEEDILKKRNNLIISKGKKLSEADEKRLKKEEEIAKLKQEALDKLERGDEEGAAATAKQANKLQAQLDAQEKVAKAAQKAMNDMVNNVISSMKAGMDSTAAYAARANARLQGLDRDYDDISWKVKGNLSLNPFISLQKTYENLNNMIHSGIAYNVEYRAFLQTLSEKVAETFDANNETLLRIVRLQQADSTASRLALESTLTEFYNKMYEDSTYLQNTFDNVSAALLEASSVMSADDAVNFEYVVQKWLGSLYSLGMSGGAVESIAQGVGLLGSGDVTALTGNDALNSLFALAASKAGIPYNELLTQGLTAKDTNDLLKAMVEYLAEIAHNEENLVVRSAYGDIFNLTQSDFKALSNLRAGDISNIYNAGDSANWTQRLKQDTSFATLFSRTTISEMTDTLVNNALYSMGESLGSNPVTQVLWKATDLLDTFAAGIPIPSISTMFAGLDLEATVSDFMRIGLAGYGLLDTAFSVISALNQGGDAGLASMERWGAASVTKRGTGFTTNPLIGRTNTSGSTVYNAASGSDVGANTVGAAEDDANKKLDEKQSKDYDSGERTITHLFQLLTKSGHDGNNAYFNIMNPDSVYSPIEAKLTTIVNALSARSDEETLKVNITKIGSKKVSDTGILDVSVKNNIESIITTALKTYFKGNDFKSADGKKTYSISDMARCIVQSFDNTGTGADGDTEGHLRVAEVGTDMYSQRYGSKNGLLDYDNLSNGWVERDLMST